MSGHRTIADVEEAQRLIAAETRDKQAELEKERQALVSAADEARRSAARERLQELNGHLIPDNEARAGAAREALAEVLASGSDPFVDALVTIVETHVARHSLHSEASSMEVTLGQPGRHVPVQLPLDVMSVIADAIKAEARRRVPQPVALPERGTRETHEQAMERERQRHHNDQKLQTYLGLSATDIAALTGDQYSEKLREADAEAERRQAEARDATLREDQARRPAFRAVRGA